MLKKNILRTIKDNSMISPNDKIIVAVSGGVDSTALLLLLNELKTDLKATIIAAHLNHMIRGRESDADEAYVKELSRRLNIKFIRDRIDVPMFAKKNKLNLEDAARRSRYGFLEKVARGESAKRVAVAHTSDDNVETFLMRLLRGAGLRGLSGIPFVRGKVIRPLMRVTRRELEGYLAAKKVKPRIDSSNFDLSYQRNRIRHQLLPALERYNKNLRKTILNTMDAVREESDQISKTAKKAFRKIRVMSDKDKVVVRISGLKRLNGTLASEVLREAFETVKGDLTDVSYVNVSDTLALIKKKRGHLDLPGIQVDSNGSELRISRECLLKIKVKEFSRKLKLPGITRLPDAGYVIETSLVKAPKGQKLMVKDPFTAYMDFNKTGKALYIRNRRDGDAFFPLGLKGKKKLQDIFVDLKVPYHERDNVPIVHDGREIIWVVGYRISDKVKITPMTGKAVKLTAKEI